MIQLPRIILPKKKIKDQLQVLPDPVMMPLKAPWIFPKQTDMTKKNFVKGSSYFIIRKKFNFTKNFILFSREDSGEERPLVINETPEPAENKRILPGNGIGAAGLPSTSGIPTSSESPAAHNLLQSIRQTMPWNIPGVGLPFPAALGEQTRTISESSSGVTHDSERISPENG